MRRNKMLKRVVRWYKNRHVRKSNKELLRNAPKDETGHALVSRTGTHLKKGYVLFIRNERGAARSILEGTYNLQQFIDAGLPRSLVNVISHMKADYQAANNNQVQMKRAWNEVFQLKDGNQTIQQRILELQMENSLLRKQLREQGTQPKVMSHHTREEALAALILDSQPESISKVDV